MYACMYVGIYISSSHKDKLNFGIFNQELRAAASNIEPKHEKEIKALMNSYKSSYPNWVFELRCAPILMFSTSLFFHACISVCACVFFYTNQ